MILNAEAGTKKIRGMSVHLVRDCSEFFFSDELQRQKHLQERRN